MPRLAPSPEQVALFTYDDVTCTKTRKTVASVGFAHSWYEFAYKCIGMVGALLPRAFNYLV